MKNPITEFRENLGLTKAEMARWNDETYPGALYYFETGYRQLSLTAAARFSCRSGVPMTRLLNAQQMKTARSIAHALGNV